MTTAQRIVQPSGTPPALSREEVLRYSRQLILEELGVEGQQALKQARVLVVGAGGLGSPALLYLAAAGVGTLGIVEYDAVEPSNLHRQILFDSSLIGAPKVDAALARLSALNPHVKLEPHRCRLSIENALSLVGSYDLVIDATDNFPTRYLVNDACVLLGKPNVSASIFRFEGQLSIFWSQRGPCYRCLYPQPPPPELAPSCAEGGVLGVLPGIVGALQASETLKLIVGVGEPLIGRLLTFDALTMQFREFRISRASDCPMCSPHAKARGLTSYEALCALRSAAAEPTVAPAVAQISVRELQNELDQQHTLLLLDVRNPAEYAIAHLEGSRLIPLPELEQRLGELPRDLPIVCYCHSGQRSTRAAQLLQLRGFSNVRSLHGGIEAWSTEVDCRMVR